MAVRRGLLIVLGLAGLILIGAYGGWWDNLLPGGQTPPRPRLPQAPGIVILKPRLTGWNNQQKSWEITAERIWQTSNGNQVYFEKITDGVIYSIEGRRIDFNAGWARWEKYRQQLYLGGGLTARTGQGSFTTEGAVMNYQQDLMVCPGRIRFTEPDLVLTAQKMQLDLGRSELRLEGQVELRQKGDLVRAKVIIYNFEDKKYQLVEPKGVTLNL